MGRFVAVVVLAFVGLVRLLTADFVTQTAMLTGFVAAAALPLVLNPTRHWRLAFWRCVDMVWAASFIGAALAAYALHAPRITAFTASLVPGLLFGTMASLGVGRSGLADIEH